MIRIEPQQLRTIIAAKSLDGTDVLDVGVLAQECISLRFELARMHALATAAIETPIADPGVARPRLRALLAQIAVPVGSQHWRYDGYDYDLNKQHVLETSAWKLSYKSSLDAFRTVLNFSREKKSAGAES